MHSLNVLLGLGLVCVVVATPPTPPCHICAHRPVIDCHKYKRCNSYHPKHVVWTVENCLCRPFQNECAMNLANCTHISKGEAPLLSVDKWHCQCSYTPKTCPTGGPQVCGYFPRYCPFDGKTYEKKCFANFCELQRYTTMKADPYDRFEEKKIKKRIHVV